MRIVVTGLLGGIVLFFWGMVAHVVLPLGHVGMHAPVNEDAVLAAMKSGLGDGGVYMLPYLAPEDMEDEAKTQAFSQKASTSPYLFAIYLPQGSDPMDMGDELGRQFASDLAAMLLVAWALGLAAFGFGKRVLISTLIGITGWLAISVPYWNWYRFPLDFTLANLVEQGVGFALAGAAMAWWLGRKGAY